MPEAGPQPAVVEVPKVVVEVVMGSMRVGGGAVLGAGSIGPVLPVGRLAVGVGTNSR